MINTEELLLLVINYLKHSTPLPQFLDELNIPENEEKLNIIKLNSNYLNINLDQFVEKIKKELETNNFIIIDYESND